MAGRRSDFWRVASVARFQIPTRVLAAAVVILAVLLLAAFLFEGRSGGTQSLPAAASARPAEPLANGQFRFFPGSSPVRLGVRYRLSLYTHCGLDWPVAVDFDGSFWDPVGPSVSDGNGNPPAGFGNPFDAGLMTLISPTSARYQSSAGTIVQFSRHPGPRISAPCS